MRILGSYFETVSMGCTLASCPDKCRVEIPKKSNGGPDECREYISPLTPCTGCPALCRRDNENLPPSPFCSIGNYPGCYGTDAGACSSNCQVPSAPDTVCEGCFDCPTDCLYDPPIRSDCSEVCMDESLAGPASTGPQDYMLALPGAAGNVEMKNAGTFMVPGLVLPLFSIVIVISFIRVFSPMLGGDIEIPGLGRII